MTADETLYEIVRLYQERQRATLDFERAQGRVISAQEDARRVLQKMNQLTRELDTLLQLTAYPKSLKETE